MSSTYTPNKGIEEPAYNDYAANPTGWTSPVNNNWTYLDTALGGSTSLNQTGLSGTQVLSTAQYRPLSLIVSGTPTSLVTYQVPSGVGGQWIIRNTSSSTVAFNSGAGGGTVAVGANSNVSISCDGTSTGMVLTNYTAPSAAGSNTQVQYNSGGILAGSAGLTFDGTTLTATGLNANGNVTLGASSGSTFIWNPNTVTLGAGAINIGSSTLYLNSGTQQVGIGTTTVGSNKLTVAGNICSTSGGYVFPDATVQTTAAVPYVPPVITTYVTSQTFTSGSGTYTTPAGVTWIRVLAAAGGGGGGGGGSGNGASGSATSFGTYTANGGAGGTGANNSYGGAGGTGGTGVTAKRVAGTSGGAAGNGSASVQGYGGGSAFFGGGGGNVSNNVNLNGQNGTGNTGGGGSGGGIASGGANGGAGGGGGECFELLINLPGASYAWVVGAGGAGGSGGSSLGGQGAAGVIYVEEHYT